MLRFNDIPSPNCVLVFETTAAPPIVIGDFTAYTQKIIDATGLCARFSQTHSVDMVAGVEYSDRFDAAILDLEEQAAISDGSATIRDINDERARRNVPAVPASSRVWVALHAAETRPSPLETATWDGLVVCGETQLGGGLPGLRFDPSEMAERVDQTECPLPAGVTAVGISGVSTEFMMSAWKNIIGESNVQFEQPGGGFMTHRMYRSGLLGWVQMAEQSLNYNWPSYP